jgi:hypothetical protein
MGGLDPPIQLLSAVRKLDGRLALASLAGRPWRDLLRTFEIIVALVCALILFVVLKVIGLVLKFALIAAVLGFGAGLLLARMLRRS